MKSWWFSLQSRERRTLTIGAAALLAILLYTLVWSPYQRAEQRVRHQADKQQQVLSLMKRHAAEVNTLRRVAPSRKGGNESLLSLADRSAKQAQLGGALKRIQPDSALSVRVWLEQARFDALLLWLGTLDSRYGVSIGALQIDRQPESGLVNARVTLQRPAP